MADNESPGIMCIPRMIGPTKAERGEDLPGKWVEVQSLDTKPRLDLSHFGQVSFPEPTGRKDDQNKSRVDLLDPEFLEGIGDVLAFGARKYAAHNWRGGISYSRLLGAILRHAFAILRGEDRDPESNLPHVHHLGCSVMFLSWTMTHRKDLDDRYRPKQS